MPPSNTPLHVPQFLAIAACVPLAAHVTSPDGAFDVHLDGGWLLDTTGMASSCVVGDLKLILRAIDSSKNQINVFSSSPAWAPATAFLTNLTWTRAGCCSVAQAIT